MRRTRSFPSLFAKRAFMSPVSRASLRRFGSPSASLWDPRVVGAADVTLERARIDLDRIGRLREWLAVLFQYLPAQRSAPQAVTVLAEQSRHLSEPRPRLPRLALGAEAVGELDAFHRPAER